MGHNSPFWPILPDPATTDRTGITMSNVGYYTEFCPTLRLALSFLIEALSFDLSVLAHI